MSPVERVMVFYYTFSENMGPASHSGAHRDAEEEFNATSLSLCLIVSEIHRQLAQGAYNG